MSPTLVRPRRGKVIAGVCAALAERFGLPTNVLRHWEAVGLLSPMAYILVLYALQQGAQVSLVAPLREMSLMMATVAGFFILKEQASFTRVAGCVVIVAGVILLSW